jgi:hypothetical protein
MVVCLDGVGGFCFCFCAYDTSLVLVLLLVLVLQWGGIFGKAVCIANAAGTGQGTL